MVRSEPDDDAWRPAAVAALAHYGLDPAALRRIPQGLINLTLKVEVIGDGTYILQRLNAVLAESVNHNLALVSAHLSSHGLLTPTLVRTPQGALAVTVAGQIWRLLTYIEGHAVDRLNGVAQARAAGGLLARFHAALLDFDNKLVSERPPGHDLGRHVDHLHAVLAAAHDHRFFEPAKELAAELEQALQNLPTLASQRARLVHGDPKISNVLFARDSDEALCWIDLDTVAYMPLALELGDAMRSWCNLQGEDAENATFDLDIFAAAISGYREFSAPFLAAEELEAIVPATLQIFLELAARFLADALEEDYFGWDASRYNSRGAHNLARARGQMAAARSLTSMLPAARAIIASSEPRGSVL